MMHTTPTEVKRFLLADPEKTRIAVQEIEEQLCDLEQVHKGRLYHPAYVDGNEVGVKITIHAVLNQDEFDYIRKIYRKSGWGDVHRISNMLYFMFKEPDSDFKIGDLKNLE